MENSNQQQNACESLHGFEEEFGQQTEAELAERQNNHTMSNLSDTADCGLNLPEAPNHPVGPDRSASSVPSQDESQNNHTMSNLSDAAGCGLNLPEAPNHPVGPDRSGSSVPSQEQQPKQAVPGCC
jgi:hypothetical protein